MTTIIRRYRRRQPARLLAGIVAMILVLVLAMWLFMAIWAKGGPQPVHDIVIAIPAPHLHAAAAPRA